MKNKLYISFISLFLLILIIPFAFTERGKGIASKIDNRMLKEFPDSIGQKDYFKIYETALNDRIGLRNQMITAYTVLNDKVYDYMVHPSYTYGKDGYVFFSYHSVKDKFEEFHKDFAEMVLKLQNYCESRGIKFYFMFEPEKKYVYERYLASGVKFSSDYWVKKFINYIDSLGINYIDNSEYLKKISLTEQVYNRQYDAGHWNDLGAFYGFNRLFERMQKDFPNVRQLTFDDFDITDDVATTLPVSYFPIHDSIKSFKLKIPNDTLNNLYNKNLKINKQFSHFHYYKRTDSVDLPRVLTFQGSYFNRKSYMIANVKEDIAVHNYQNVLDFDYYVNMFQPDAVVFEVAEYVFNNTYFNQERMKNLKFNPQLQENDFVSGNSKITYKIINIILALNIPNKDNIEYVWLKNRNKVYNCKVLNNLYCTSIAQNIDEDCKVYIQYSDGSKKYMPVTQAIVADIELIAQSGGVTITDTNYVYVTELDGNEFNNLVVHLHNPRKNTYNAIFYNHELERYFGVYFHEDDSGEYIINLRGNTNLSDEMIQYKVYLEHGGIYTYEFKIDSFSTKKIIARDFCFK